MLFCCSVMSDSLRRHGLQHARLPCPLLLPEVCSNSCPLNWWCHLTILSSCTLLFLLSIIPRIRVYSSESALCIGWSQYYSFSFRISLSNEYSYLISFRIDWFYLLALQGTLKSILQQHSLEASILPCSACLIVQLSHLYMTTRKTIALTIWTFVDKVMSLLFNTQSRFLLAFLSRSKHLLVSCLQSPSTVILEPKKIKSVTVTVSVVFPSICHEDGTRCHDLCFLNVEF